MLNLYRRHRATCKSSARRAKCSCPIWVQGVLQGESVRKSLDLTNWEAASRRIRDWESDGMEAPVTVKEATERFLADRQSMNLSEAMMRKYRNVAAELNKELENRPVKSVTTDDLRRIREGWTLSPVTTQKRLEMVRKFFTFCEDSDWIEKNPAKKVNAPPAKYDPTLPFSDQEMEKILWAAESIREAHPKIPVATPKKLKALILLMRYSGVRISDAVMFKRDKMKDGKLFLKQEKTKQNVWVPLPQFVVDAVMDCAEGNEYFFYKQIGKPKSALTEWQQRLKLVYEMAGIVDGHSHRLRDTFSVELLQKGVSLETVSMLLGHQNIRVTQKHYAPWVKQRQDALEAAVMKTWEPVAPSS